MAKQLKIALGQCSRTGKRNRNEDYYGCVTPDGETQVAKGIAIAIADGVGGGSYGREAAEEAVKSFLESYYGSPDTWSMSKRLEETLKQVNDHIYGMGVRKKAQGNMATTFSAVILRGRRFHTAHVGDSRIYLARGGNLQQITKDHRWDHPDMPNALTRAIGLDTRVLVDYAQESLKTGDVFVLCTDGLTGVVPDERITAIVAEEKDEQEASELLARAAIDAGGKDNITIQIARVEELPDERYGDLQAEVVNLPFAKDIRPGMEMDDFQLIKRIHNGHMASIFLADDKRSGDTVALKFPNPRYADDPQFVDRFLREEWASKTVSAEHVLGAVPTEPGRRSALYYAMPYFDGETLRQRIKRKTYISVDEVVDIGIQLCKGLYSINRRGIVHRDIKPENIFITKDGIVKIIDLGVSRVEALAPPDDEGKEYSAPGTPTYMAPELFKGAMGDERSDVYALGVTLYELLTRKFPYGEIEPFSKPRFTRWIPPSRYNPETTGWLEAVLQKATQADINRRHEAATEMKFQLENPGKGALSPVSQALMERDPTAIWKFAAIGLGLVCIILGALLAAG